MWKRLIPWTTESAGQLSLTNYHTNVKLFGILKLNNIYLDRFKNKFENASLLFQIEMLTSSIVILSVFGGLVALLVILKCIG